MAKMNPWTEFATGFVERTNVRYAEKQKDYRDNQKLAKASRSAAKLKQIGSDIDTSTKQKQIRAVATKYMMGGKPDELAQYATKGIKNDEIRAQFAAKYQKEIVELDSDEAITKWLDTHFEDGKEVDPNDPKYDAYYTNLGETPKPNHVMFAALGYNPNKHVELARKTDAAKKAEVSFAGRAPAEATIDFLGKKEDKIFPLSDKYIVTEGPYKDDLVDVGYNKAGDKLIFLDDGWIKTPEGTRTRRASDDERKAGSRGVSPPVTQPITEAQRTEATVSLKAWVDALEDSDDPDAAKLVEAIKREDLVTTAISEPLSMKGGNYFEGVKAKMRELVAARKLDKGGFFGLGSGLIEPPKGATPQPSAAQEPVVREINGIKYKFDPVTKKNLGKL